MTNKTPLHSRHVAAGARMVDFGGWDMPLHYGSQIDEHHAVRGDAGIFDVSHMTVVDVAGPDARAYLRRLLANDVAKLAAPGKGLYGWMLDESGGIVDDLITYRLTDGAYRVVVNAATRAADLAWMSDVAAAFDVSVTERPEAIMLAIQGPRSVELAAPLLPSPLRQQAASLASFGCAEADGTFVARTGYTGEDGFEIILDEDAGLRLWDAAVEAGVAPCGLGARDTLRLEAGLCLYGQDMDTTTSPLVSGLGWTVAWEPPDRDFVGRDALESEKKAGIPVKWVGLILEDRGIMRHGQRIVTSAGDGIVTSGGFSPTIQRSIALARVPGDAAGVCEVEIRNALRDARIVRPTFVRNGEILVDLNID
ncbi:MAG: glycine cleavage system aminomethyltransferase GcvT [Gammaproteobacteria bacterium]|nr:glycine cleavage system aminomethyltransferase GcvT [Gammaproteobacteria bacterium]